MYSSSTTPHMAYYGQSAAPGAYPPQSVSSSLLPMGSQTGSVGMTSTGSYMPLRASAQPVVHQSLGYNPLTAAAVAAAAAANYSQQLQKKVHDISILICKSLTIDMIKSWISLSLLQLQLIYRHICKKGGTIDHIVIFEMI